MKYTSKIGDAYNGADGGATFGKVGANAAFLYSAIKVHGYFSAPGTDVSYGLSIDNAVKFSSSIAAKFDGINFGVMKADYFDYALPNDEGAFICVGLHQHNADDIREPRYFLSTDDKWYKYNGKNSAGALLAPGESPLNWQQYGSDDSTLISGCFLSTYMSNITQYRYRDNNGDVVKDTYYNNNGVPVNVVDTPNAVQEAPLRMMYFNYHNNSSVTGYYPPMVP